MEHEILRLEEGIRAAFAANDLPTYFGFFSADSTAMTPEGLVEHPRYVATWTEYIARGNRVLSLEYDGIRVRTDATADAAVATFAVHVKIFTIDQGITDEWYRETDVWFKQHGEWKLVHAQYAKASVGADEG